MTERDLFLSALDLPPADRPAYLDRACAGNPDLRRKVDGLLAAHAAAGSFLEPDPPSGGRESPEPVGLRGLTSPARQAETHDLPADPPTASHADSDRTALHTPPPEAGTVLGGKYKLVEPIGEGGMGTVWVARQTEPVKRVVAVKLIKAGMDSRAVLARFEAERQALALMDHPNIAKVLDAGAAPGGRPYFVMELVKGVPITAYCDERRLTPRQRLGLFVPVCQAIQHAHQKGVIHRDLKPSNVLVALYDDRPVPKVIDFGVAKAAGATLTDQTLMTGFGAVVGTPEYMSPEQASLNNLDVDTRSDVYSLGVLLYELLTGTTPVDRRSLGKAAVLEVLRIVREVEAPRPSHKLSTADALPSIAANRGTEPGRLTKLMRAELDWVVLKALEKDRARRYETANGLARDIQRYLADEVVEARPPSTGYRVRKFVRRHRGQVAAAGLVLVALVAGIAGTTWQAVRAEHARAAEAERAEGERRARADAEVQRTRAESERDEKEKARAAEAAQKVVAQAKQQEAEVARAAEAAAGADAKAFGDFLANNFLAATRPKGVQRGQGVDVKVSDALAQAEADIPAVFRGRPAAEARARHAVGVTWRNLARYDRAADNLRRAVDLRDRALGPDHPDTLDSVNSLAVVYGTMNDPRRAEPLYRRALEAGEKALGPDHLTVLGTANNLAALYHHRGEYGAAEPLYRRALAGFERALGRDHPNTLTTVNNLGALCRARGDPARAEPLLVRALAGCEKTYGPDHPLTLTSAANLGLLYQDRGELSAAEPLLARAAAGQEKALGPDHPNTLQTVNNLATLYWRMGRLDRSVPLFEDCLSRRRVLGDDHPDTLMTLANLGVNYKDAGRPAEAVPLLERAYAARAEHPLLGVFGGPLVDAYAAVGRPADAARVVGEQLAEGRAKVKPGSPELGGLLAQTGKRLLDLDPAAAEPVLRECLELREKLAPAAWTTANAKSLLGDALLLQGKPAEAEPLLVAGYEGLLADRTSIPPIPAAQANLPEAADRLVELYRTLGKPDEAAKWRAERSKYPPPAAPPPRPAK